MTRIACFLALCCFASPVLAQDDAGTTAPWPRELTDGEATVTLHQPQVESWTDYEFLTARMAAVVQLEPDAPPLIGALYLRIQTFTELETRTVSVVGLDSLGINFPSVEDQEALEAGLDRIVGEAVEASKTWSLDEVLATLDAATAARMEYELQMAPPPVYYSEAAAVLVIFDGEPFFAPVEEESSLEFAVNTNWDVFRIAEDETYYLLVDGHWLEGNPASQQWTWTDDLPRGMPSLPDTENFVEARTAAQDPQVPEGAVPVVYASESPAELIQIEGAPQLETLPDSSLLYVGNTNSDLLYDIDGQLWYLLISGRWFTSAEGKTEWTPLEGDLPEDFLRIDPEGDLAHLLVAVPGTPQAEQAILEAQIPQQAEVPREGIEPEVEYAGDPEFEAIEDTEVARAVNTSADVLEVDGQYYCVQEGVWFVASSPSGPWIVCDTVPQPIYTIPPSSPSFHVTFVRSYWHSSTHVVFGFTSGYMGVYVGGGCIRYGTGWYYPPYFWYPPPMWGPRYPIYYPPRFYSYGCSAWYNPRTGGYMRGGRVYGPYGGVGRAAYYNPRTGTYARGAGAWGPAGGTWGATAYNPRTGTSMRTRQNVNPYGSWGSSVVRRGDDWAQTAHRRGPEGSAAGWRNSEGGKGIVTDRHGDRSFAAKTGDDDLYVGRDGEVYRRDEDGWQKHDGDGGWQPVDKGDREASTTREARPGTEDQPRDTREARPETRESKPETRESRPADRPSTQPAPESRPSREAQPADRSRELDQERQNRQNSYDRQRSQPTQRSQPDRPQRRGGGGRGRRGR